MSYVNVIIMILPFVGAPVMTLWMVSNVSAVRMSVAAVPASEILRRRSMTRGIILIGRRCYAVPSFCPGV